MSKYAEVVAIVEGKTEEYFVKELLAPHLIKNNIYITPIIASKPRQKGGDIKFARIKNDVEKHLKQRIDTYVTIIVDYYGINKDWPGMGASKSKNGALNRASAINSATKSKIKETLPNLNIEKRFIPYVSMHELEALLFSAPEVLARNLGVEQAKIEQIIIECGEPENINDKKETAPSKRLLKLSRRFKKINTGIAVFRDAGIVKIREKCPIFNAWLEELENLGN